MPAVGPLASTVPNGGGVDESARIPADDARASCGLEHLVLEGAEFILANRMSLPRFRPPRFGTLSMYLALRYGDISAEDGMARLLQLRDEDRRPPHFFEELALSFAIPHFGFDEALARLKLDTPSFVLSAPSVDIFRAVVLKGEETAFYRHLNKVAAAAETKSNPEFDTWRVSTASYFLALSDQSDATKLIAGVRAEQEGFLVLGASLLASRDDIGPYLDLVDREGADSRAGPRFIEPGFATVHRETSVLNRSISLTEARSLNLSEDDTQGLVALGPDYHLVKQAMFQERGTTLIGLYHNQTGRNGVVYRVSTAYLDAYSDGTLGPDWDYAKDRLFVLETLINSDLLGSVPEFLKSINISDPLEYGAKTPSELLDRLSALRALAPYVRGDTESAPGRPALVSDDLSFDTWLSVARSLKRGQVPQRPDEVRIAIELLAASGNWDRAIELTQERLDLADGIPLMRGLIQRMDHKCAGYTSFVGAPVLLGNRPLYRFD